MLSTSLSLTVLATLAPALVSADRNFTVKNNVRPPASFSLALFPEMNTR
jgi:hypothetical protein